MKLLANEEKKNWPQITPVLGLGLVDKDISKGPWAMAQSPMEFAKAHDLLIIEKVTTQLGGPTYETDIKKPLARQMFVRQMGRRWTDAKDLKPHERALFGIFAARMNRDRDDAHKLINQIAISSGASKLDFGGGTELMNKHLNSKAVQKIISNHGFVLTVMASMLLGAREDGVVASCDFIWLKPVDRSLWYVLNTVGRQTPFSEVAGPFAHWIAEKNLGRSIKTPMIEEAVNGLIKGVAEIKYIPED